MRDRREAKASRHLRAVGLAVLVGIATVHAPASAQSGKVRISGLTDVSYGTINNLQSDSRRNQSICVSATDGQYTVTASGTGPGGALELSSGVSSLPYTVEWNAAPGQSFGEDLPANSVVMGQSTPERQQDCKSRGLQTASVIVVLRGAELSRAIQGAYSGTLSLLIAAQ